MEKKFAKKWSKRDIFVKVTNNKSGRVDLHKFLSKEEIGWIKTNPNLKVEVLESKVHKNESKKNAA